MKRAVILGVSLVLVCWFVLRLLPERINHWAIINDGAAADGGIVCFGDSLVAGVGAGSATGGYPAQLSEIVGRGVRAVGVPGLTSEEGAAHLKGDASLGKGIVVVTLGGNDILRQIPRDRTEVALAEIFEELQRRGSLVVFTGVEGLLSSGRGKFYADLCRRHGVVLVPDVLQGILSDKTLKSDQIHPNAAGYRIMAERVAAVLRQYLGPVPKG